jgi:hypothetical protein
MKVIRNISIEHEVWEKATKFARRHDYASFSSFVEKTLIAAMETTKTNETPPDPLVIPSAK